MSVMPEPAATGRGAWSKRGNLKASSTYQRDCSVGVNSVTNQDQWAVNRGVWVIQALLNFHGHVFSFSTAPGIFGPKTEAATKAFQEEKGLVVSGRVGQTTIKSLLRPVVEAQETKHGIPDDLLWGLIGNESSFDPGAIGYYTPKDVGVCQINLYYNQSVSPDQAADVFYAVPLTASRLRTRFNEYRVLVEARGGTLTEAWDAAILGHNSPARARTYAKTGVYPTAQAAEYVARVRKASQIV